MDISVGEEIIYRVGKETKGRRGIVSDTGHTGMVVVEVHEIDMISRNPTGTIHHIPFDNVDCIITEEQHEIAYDRAMRGI